MPSGIHLRLCMCVFVFIHKALIQMFFFFCSRLASLGALQPVYILPSILQFCLFSQSHQVQAHKIVTSFLTPYYTEEVVQTKPVLIKLT